MANQRFFSLLVLFVIAFGFIPQAVWAGQTTEEFVKTSNPTNDLFSLDPIHIIYDPENKTMRKIAETVFEVASLILKNVRLVPAESFSELSYWLDEQPWLVVYAFNTNLTHVLLPEDEITWTQFYELIYEHQEIRHILGLGNTLSLPPNLSETDEFIISSESGQTDALLLVLHDLWGIAAALEGRATSSKDYEQAALAFKSIVTKLYTDNFNQLFKRTLEPIDVVGQLDEATLKERAEKMWERHAPTIEPTVYHLAENGSLIKVSESMISTNFTPTIKLSSFVESETTSDFSLGELPLFSGLRGPIGEIVDALLSLLAETGSTEILIPRETINQIMDIYKTIEPILGIVKDFDASSPMKSIVQALSSQFPFLEKYKSYLNLLLKCLFSLRGDKNSVLEVVSEAIFSLLPELFPDDVPTYLVNLLGSETELESLLNDVISKGTSIFAAILSFFTENVLSAFFNKTLVAVFSLSQTDASKLLIRMNAFAKSILNFLSTRDFSVLNITVGETLLKDVLKILDQNDMQFLTDLMSIFKVATTVTKLTDKFTMESVIDIVRQFLTTILGPEITTSAEALAQDVMNVVKTFKEGDGPSFADVAAFRGQVTSVIQNAVTASVSSELVDIVVDTFTMVGGYFVEGFPKTEVPSLFTIGTKLANHFLDTNKTAWITKAFNEIVKPIYGIVATITDSDSLRVMVSQTLENFELEFDNIPSLIVDAVHFLDLDDFLDSVPGVNKTLDVLAQIAYAVMKIVGASQSKSFVGVMNSILVTVAGLVGTYPAFDDVPIDAFLVLLESLFPKTFDIPVEERSSKSQVVNELSILAAGHLGTGFDIADLTKYTSLLMDLKGIFTDGVNWLVENLFDWLAGQLQPLFNGLTEQIATVLDSNGEIFGYHGKLPIGLGDWSLFELTLDLGLVANFQIDPQPLFNLIASILFDARQIMALDTAEDFFEVVFRCLTISPQFYADLGVAGFDTAKNALMSYLLSVFGLELTFTGSAHFVLNLFTFRGGIFEWEHFMQIVEWGFHIKIALSRVFTFLDFVTGGAGGALNTIGKYIGLDAISVTVMFGVTLDIVKMAATAVSPEVSTLTLAITIGTRIHLGIDIIFAELAIEGILEILFSFSQDLTGRTPLKIHLGVVLTIKFIVQFLFWSDSWDFDLLNSLWDISPHKGDTEYHNSGIGFDSDADGLGDDYETNIPGLNPNSADTDGDGAPDKLEVQTMYTDATDPDSDDDGLLDGEEWLLGTSPLEPDSDWDTISDYDEVRVYGTNPLSQDTDGDALTDDYEIFTSWNITCVTPTVTEVVIGGVSYNDHTDPLNPDTDGDGLLDGQEGPMGAYYGLPILYNETPGSGFDPDPLIFNNGYTHPLDADTDDDSYLQLYNGAIDTQALKFLMDMNDGNEVNGFRVIFYDERGMPEERLVFTNPCNPDSDGDTGVTDRTPQPGLWLNSDGYELAQDPPTDPNNADSDGDGLIDGIEGVLNPKSNHTNPNVADTDGDGLYDMQEILTGCDPRSPDSDGDLITDGDEFYKYHTNPLIADTDFDGLNDGEEVFLWHSNPLLDDSDGDAIKDGKEVLVYCSDPMDEDSDNDGLTDFEEILIYYTDCFQYDTDGDMLSDGDEIHLYGTDPLSWDTDKDSITEPNADGAFTWPMSDYDEIMTYGTNATSPDSDLDALSDAIELYFGSGQIPWLDPLPLDPLSNDTDGDQLLDGQELLLVNVSDIVYPYVSITVLFKYNTNPCNNDTDGDLLTDYQEVIIFNTDANNTDTDNDTIDDWHEIWVYNTSALTNDTDGDGLWDFEETLIEVWPYGPWPPSDNSTTRLNVLYAKAVPKLTLSQTYATSATDPDSDDDYLPDGAEVHFYQTDPTDPDTDNNGISDGMEFDTDLDGLEDGLEFLLGTQGVLGGGIQNPDSDLDGLLDGKEYYLYGTDPTSVDTDGDGFSDGAEVAVGTDPLVYTTLEEFLEKIAIAMGKETIRIMTPLAGRTISESTPVSVYNYTTFQEMWFRYKTDADWSDNVSLQYNPTTQLWYNNTVVWSQGSYVLQVFGRTPDGDVYYTEIEFVVAPVPMNFLWWVVAALAVTLGVVTFGLLWTQGLGDWIRKRRGKASEAPTESEETPDDEKPVTKPRKEKPRPPAKSKEDVSSKKTTTKRKKTSTAQKSARKATKNKKQTKTKETRQTKRRTKKSGSTERKEGGE